MAFTHLMTSVLPSLRVPSTARVQSLADVVFGRKRHIFYAYLYLFILTSCMWSLCSVMIYDLFVSCLTSSFYRLRKQLLDSQHAIVGGMSVSSLTPDEKQLISSRYMTQCAGNIPDTVQTSTDFSKATAYSILRGMAKSKNEIVTPSSSKILLAKNSLDKFCIFCLSTIYHLLCYNHLLYIQVPPIILICHNLTVLHLTLSCLLYHKNLTLIMLLYQLIILLVKVFLLILVPITVMLFAFQPILQLTSLYK